MQVPNKSFNSSELYSNTDIQATHKTLSSMYAIFEWIFRYRHFYFYEPGWRHLNVSWLGGAHFLRISTTCSGKKLHFNTLFWIVKILNSKDQTSTVWSRPEAKEKVKHLQSEEDQKQKRKANYIIL